MTAHLRSGLLATATFLLIVAQGQALAPAPPSPPQAPSTTGGSYPSQATVGSYGGTIGIANQVVVNFAGNSFPAPSTVSIGPNTLPDPELAYADTSNLFLPVQRGTYFYTITSSGGQPLVNPTVTFTIPDFIGNNATSSEQGRLMYFNLLEDQGETLEGVEVTNVRVFPVATGATIMAELPLFAFYNASMAVTVANATFPPNLYFAHILIFTSATGPTASLGAPPAVGTPGGAGGPNGPGGNNQPCAGATILYPTLRQYEVEDPFGPRPDGRSFHDGVDIDPIPIGTPVYAAHAGTVDIHASRQGLNGGYGYFIILTGEVGSTLYGHLTPGSSLVAQGRNATAGQQIAFSGVSGATDDPLLHFTYVPNGKIYATATAVNPVPCFAP